MKYELIHDTIARQISEKASTEARTRRKIEKQISERYGAYQERGAKLTQYDIEYFTPYLNQVNITAAEAAFIENEQRALKQARQRVRVGVIAAIGVLIAFSTWSYLQVQALKREKRERVSEVLTRNPERINQLDFAGAEEVVNDALAVSALPGKTQMALGELVYFYAEAEKY